MKICIFMFKSYAETVLHIANCYAWCYNDTSA